MYDLIATSIYYFWFGSNMYESYAKTILMHLEKMVELIKNKENFQNFFNNIEIDEFILAKIAIEFERWLYQCTEVPIEEL